MLREQVGHRPGSDNKLNSYKRFIVGKAGGSGMGEQEGGV